MKIIKSAFLTVFLNMTLIGLFALESKADLSLNTKEQIQFKSAKTIKSGASMDALLGMELITVNNKKIKLSDFKKSKVFLIVNTASKCGYTSQYEGLESLHKKFKDKGLAVIAFPSNDFGSQEPGTNEQIQEFCKLNYGVTFPLMLKASVKGQSTQPFYKALLNLSSDKSDIGWNFEKFLITREGSKIERFKSGTTPKDLDKIISGILLR